MTDYTPLIERLEGAETQLDDETLGRVICVAHGRSFGSTSIACGDDGSDEFQLDDADDKHVFSAYRHRCPDVSIDAALALVERCLPGWTTACDATAPDIGIDWQLFGPNRAEFVGTAPTHALALCLALLKALEAQRG